RGDFICLFHLRQNLSFADHHAVEAGGDGKQMSYEILARVLEEAVEDLVHGEAVKLGQRGDCIVMCGAELWRLAGEIELDPVAGRKEHRLGLRIAAAKARQRFGGLVAIERQSLADLDRRRVVAAADHVEFHDRPSGGGRAEFKVSGSKFKVGAGVHTSFELWTLNFE